MFWSNLETAGTATQLDISIFQKVVPLGQKTQLLPLCTNHTKLINKTRFIVFLLNTLSGFYTPSTITLTEKAHLQGSYSPQFLVYIMWLISTSPVSNMPLKGGFRVWCTTTVLITLLHKFMDLQGFIHDLIERFRVAIDQPPMRRFMGWWGEHSIGLTPQKKCTRPVSYHLRADKQDIQNVSRTNGSLCWMLKSINI